MKLPRDVSGKVLVRALIRFGYTIVRQTGAHARLTTQAPSEHHVTVPMHDTIKIGTLSDILDDVSSHAQMSREDLLQILDL